MLVSVLDIFDNGLVRYRVCCLCPILIVAIGFTCQDYSAEQPLLRINDFCVYILLSKGFMGHFLVYQIKFNPFARQNAAFLVNTYLVMPLYYEFVVVLHMHVAHNNLCGSPNVKSGKLCCLYCDCICIVSLGVSLLYVFSYGCENIEAHFLHPELISRSSFLLHSISSNCKTPA